MTITDRPTCDGRRFVYTGSLRAKIPVYYLYWHCSTLRKKHPFNPKGCFLLFFISFIYPKVKGGNYAYKCYIVNFVTPGK